MRTAFLISLLGAIVLPLCLPAAEAAVATFTVYDVALSFQEADSYCAARGATLLTFKNSSYYDSYIAWESGVPASSLPAWSWMSGTDVAVEGTWRWGDGTVFFYKSTGCVSGAWCPSNWVTTTGPNDQPDNFGGTQDYSLFFTKASTSDVLPSMKPYSGDDNIATVTPTKIICQGPISVDVNGSAPMQCGTNATPLRIVFSSFGTLDVTTKVAYELLSNGILDTTASTAVFTDPMSGYAETLTIVLNNGSVFTYPSGSRVYLDVRGTACPVLNSASTSCQAVGEIATTPQIMYAQFGPQDVTQVLLSKRASDNWVYAPVTTTVFGDPLPNVVKYLHIAYSDGNVYSYKEGEQVSQSLSRISCEPVATTPPAPPPQCPSASTMLVPLRIVFSSFGSLDVTTKVVYELLSNGILDTTASTAVFTDPMPGRVKRMTIVLNNGSIYYYPDGSRVHLDVRGTTCVPITRDVPCSAGEVASPPQFLFAQYGPLDVTGMVRAISVDGVMTATVSNTLWGDPLPFVAKYLSIVMSDGRVFSNADSASLSVSLTAPFCIPDSSAASPVPAECPSSNASRIPLRIVFSSFGILDVTTKVVYELLSNGILDTTASTAVFTDPMPGRVKTLTIVLNNGSVFTYPLGSRVYLDVRGTTCVYRVEGRRCADGEVRVPNRFLHAQYAFLDVTQVIRPIISNHSLETTTANGVWADPLFGVLKYLSIVMSDGTVYAYPDFTTVKLSFNPSSCVRTNQSQTAVATFTVYDVALSFREADSYCAARGATLLTFKNSSYYDSYLAWESGVPASSLPTWSWMSGTDVAVEGTWRWGDGTVFFYKSTGCVSGAWCPSNWVTTTGPNDQPDNFLGNQDYSIFFTKASTSSMKPHFGDDNIATVTPTKIICQKGDDVFGKNGKSSFRMIPPTADPVFLGVMAGTALVAGISVLLAAHYFLCPAARAQSQRLTDEEKNTPAGAYPRSSSAPSPAQEIVDVVRTASHPVEGQVCSSPEEQGGWFTEGEPVQPVLRVPEPLPPAVPREATRTTTVVMVAEHDYDVAPIVEEPGGFY